MTITTVADIELLGTQGGYVLRCDKCGVYLDAHVRRAKGPEAIRQIARDAGWTGPMTRETDQDRCPDCRDK